jgi:hypothetical protein
MKALRILGSAFFVGVVVMGSFEIARDFELLATERGAVCCEDSDCKPYHEYQGGTMVLKIPRCSDEAHVRDFDNCGSQETQTCGVCVDRQNDLELCWLAQSNEYCCEIDPTVGFGYDDYCPEQYRRYACDWLSVSISAPSSLAPNQSGTFTANVSGGEPSFSYQWYEYRYCAGGCGEKQANPPSTDELTCCTWKPVGMGYSTFQVSDQWDFKLKVKVTDNCWAGSRSVMSSEHYVTVEEAFAKRQGGTINKQSSLESEGLMFEIKNYPNPFNPSTIVGFRLLQATSVSLAVYNLRGQQVRVLIPSDRRSSGTHTVVWDGKNEYGADAASGMYLCRLSAGQHVKTIRLLLTR